MGWFLGTAMGVSYTSYLETHVRHHAYLNRPEDWELWPYAQPAISLSFRRVFVWFDLIFGCWTSPMIYSRIFFSKKSSDLSEQSRRVIKLEYLVILVTWLTIGLLVLRFHYWAKFVKMWVTPLAISGILQTGRKLTEHLGMKSFDPLLGTRTVVAHPWLSRICSFLNFHIFVHGPHHTQGHVPMFPDGEVSVQTGGQTPFFRSPIFPCYQKALRQMLPYLFKNPGVGTNID